MSYDGFSGNVELDVIGVEVVVEIMLMLPKRSM